MKTGAGRAAGRRWGAEAFPALQISGNTCTRHQIKGQPYFSGLTRNELPSVLQATEGRLRTRKPNIHAVVAVFSVVAVKNTNEQLQGGATANDLVLPVWRWWCTLAW